MQSSPELPSFLQLRYPGLPLAVYREVAAHLEQVSFVKVQLLPQTSQTFDYHRSQVGGLRLDYLPGANGICHQQATEILAYYGDRYGTWEFLGTPEPDSGEKESTKNEL